MWHSYGCKRPKKLAKISDKKRGANSVLSAPNWQLVKALRTTVAPQDRRVHVLCVQKNFSRRWENARLKRTNLPVKRLSLNRSQYKSCSARYDTSTES